MVGFGNSKVGYGDEPLDAEPSVSDMFSMGLRDIKNKARNVLSGPSHRLMPSYDGSTDSLSAASDGEYPSHSRHHGAHMERPQIASQDLHRPDELVSKRQEEKILSKFCMASGIRVAPTTDECSRCLASLNKFSGKRVAQAIETKIVCVLYFLVWTFQRISLHAWATSNTFITRT